MAPTCHIGCHVGVISDSLIPLAPFSLPPRSAMPLKAPQRANETPVSDSHSSLFSLSRSRPFSPSLLPPQSQSLALPRRALSRSRSPLGNPFANEPQQEFRLGFCATCKEVRRAKASHGVAARIGLVAVGRGSCSSAAAGSRRRGCLGAQFGSPLGVDDGGDDEQQRERGSGVERFCAGRGVVCEEGR